jgi:glucose/arabinose dehydrogenase
MTKKASVFLGLSVLMLSAAASAADRPGDRFSITPAELPKPYETPAVDNSSHVVPRAVDQVPTAPAGFAISVFAWEMSDPRFMVVAPNGDVFVSEPRASKVTLLRTVNGKTVASTFASGFDVPHGLALHDGALYVGDLKAVWRLPYKDGQLKETSRERVTSPPQLGRPGGHVTRDIAFDTKGTLFIAIGSRDNIEEDPLPEATVQMVDKSGALSTYASGTRNPVGIAFYPGTDDLFVTVNERDGLGDGLVPDYLTHLEKGGFYGWPYAYTGHNPDPTFGKKRPDMVAKTIVPDLLFQSHSAPLGLVFYEGDQFPAAYKGDAFVALHGSWNSGKPTGYKVVRVHFANGRPTGSYENFLTGWWDGTTSPAHVWGRPAGLAVAKDGSLLVSDDVAKMIWRITYTGK